MERYICIHGHFYQPPRENPWLERIELQDSAFPYHDWNERITHECYAANGASRMLESDGRITQIVNNYARMSFNFGPTLLSWMETHAPSAYQSVLAADRESQHLFSGHGSALAQVYNHMIMPLANRRDKYTQVRWGIADFHHRFGRLPEGMWLAETAADLETLDILAELGITFTILSPYQAKRVRPVGEKDWVDATGGKIDPTMAYVQRLPSGRTIALFFYDGPISQGVAFEGLLRRGENLANRLVGAFSEERSWPQLVHIATDGETYGHHHRYGDMALAYALHYITSNNLARLTVYGEYLEQHPPQHEVEIIEHTSWSCPHGVERWRSNCGCHSGGHPEWDQQWRAPLRAALDWLRNTLTAPYEKEARRLLKDPWAARDAYLHVILNRSREQAEHFFHQHAARSLTEAEMSTALKLLELQRHAMLMYTSCGWFFDELSGIETVQVIQYAGRVIQLAQEALSTPSPRDSLEEGFVKRLAFAKSNLPEYRDGAHIYELFVKPAMVDLKKVLAHYAVSSFFESYPQAQDDDQPGMAIYCYTVECRDSRMIEAGKVKLTAGWARVSSNITWDAIELSYGVLHFGDHNLTGGVRQYREAEYQEMVREVTEAFWRADLPEVIRLLDKHFLELTYSLRTLFRDEQRKILRRILGASLESAEAAYRQVYENNAPLMRFLADLRIPLPQSFRTAADFVLNMDLRRAFEHEDIEVERIHTILEEVRRGHIELDTTELAHTLKETLEWMEQRMLHNPTDLPLLKRLVIVVELAQSLPFEVDFWDIQNVYYEMQQSVYPSFDERAHQGDETAQGWVHHFLLLGQKLGFRVAES
ncbi:MAG: DUF3536 domain-containing protein [Chloroflexaceae bacterium]|nr:DUF3536 domain-containing protein [Chloroflexaceae bacterium]